jgi:hypothetical protein
MSHIQDCRFDGLNFLFLYFLSFFFYIKVFCFIFIIYCKQNKQKRLDPLNKSFFE